MGEKWPSMRGRRLLQIIEKHCDLIKQRGSHRIYKSRRSGTTLLVAFHDREDVPGDLIRRILMTEVGLSKAEARKEVS